MPPPRTLSLAASTELRMSTMYEIFLEPKTKEGGIGAPIKTTEKGWTERADPLEVFNIHFVAKHQKIKGGTLWEKIFFRKKSHNAEKTERGDPLVSPGMVCYAEKQEKPFWFSSLGQIVQFGAIIFCRTFVELFWSAQVVLKNTDEKP